MIQTGHGPDREVPPLFIFEGRQASDSQLLIVCRPASVMRIRVYRDLALAHRREPAAAEPTIQVGVTSSASDARTECGLLRPPHWRLRFRPRPVLSLRQYFPLERRERARVLSLRSPERAPSKRRRTTPLSLQTTFAVAAARFGVRRRPMHRALALTECRISVRARCRDGRL